MSVVTNYGASPDSTPDLGRNWTKHTKSSGPNPAATLGPDLASPSARAHARSFGPDAAGNILPQVTSGPNAEADVELEVNNAFICMPH